MEDSKRLSNPPTKPFRNWTLTAVKYLGVFSILVASLAWLDNIKHRFYVFEPNFLHELAESAIASSSDAAGMVDYIVKNLTQTYSADRVSLNTDSKEWVLHSAGGALGQIYFIHSSVTEYIMIYSAPFDTEGHTGILTADDYFHVLAGEQWAYGPGQLEVEKYTPGMVHKLRRGERKHYKALEGCLALDYARGWIPLMMPYAFADTLTSNFDVPSLVKMVMISGREMGKNLWIGKI